MAVSVADPDVILIREHLGGERDAFDVLYRRYFPRLVRMCTKLTRDSAAAEDIAQETLVRAHDHLARFDQSRPMWPWLKTVATRVLVDQLRAQSRELLTAEHPEDTAHADHGWSEEREVLTQALSKLPPRQRAAVALRYVEDWDGPEAAEFLGLSGLAFRQILHRAKRKLQTEYRRIAEPVMGALLFPAGWLRRSGQKALEHTRHLTSNPEAVKAAAAVTAINLVVATAAVFGGADHGASPSVVRSAPPNQLATSAIPETSSHPDAAREVRDSSAPSTPSVPAGVSASQANGHSAEGNAAQALNDRSQDVASGVTEPNKDVSQPEDATLFPPVFSPRFASDNTIFLPGAAECRVPQCSPVLFRSTDAGVTWTRLEADGFDGRQILLPPAFGAGDDRIFAMGPVGLEVSEDGGSSFRSVSTTPVAVGTGSSAISPGFNNGDPVILIGDQSLMEYRDDVKTIGPTRPVPGRGPLHPAFSPSYEEDGLLLVGGLQVDGPSWTPSVFRCTVEFCTGSPLDISTSDTPRVHTTPDFSASGVVYAYSGGALFISRDRGASFSRVTTPWSGQMNDLAAAGNGNVFVALQGSGPDSAGDIYASSDDGLSWIRVDAPLLTSGVTAVRVVGSRVLATLLGGGVACSADGGTTWAARCPVPPLGSRA